MAEWICPAIVLGFVLYCTKHVREISRAHREAAEAIKRLEAVGNRILDEDAPDDDAEALADLNRKLLRDRAAIDAFRMRNGYPPVKWRFGVGTADGGPTP